MAVTAIAAIAGLAFSAYKYGHAQSKENKEKMAIDRLRKPFLKIQDEYFQNRNIAEEQAMSGMPSATKNYLDSQRRKGLGTSIAGLLQSGVHPGEVGKLFETYDNAISADAARDAEMRTKNIDYFINVNKDLAGQKTTQFVANELAPYERKLKQMSQNVAIEEANKNEAINSGISSLSSLGTSLSNSNLLKSTNTAPAGNDPVMAGRSSLSKAIGNGGWGTTPTNSNIINNLFSDNAGLVAPNLTGANYNWYNPVSKNPYKPTAGGDDKTLSQDELNDIFKLIEERMSKR